ncbi:hypothetical protein GGI03_004791 [Coemansia sp. RSA 2337]|nr:hypothetical protein LPJ71_009914 [Coemansia sp. S17]KAJ2044873.1 hypothetical protein H4S04_005970 [Coemansia sp. S16]KAJ2069891.1 hypothetical protein GGH13_004354 [Coemansia sp. S155-1]KAJ2089785.1 hypothetical protein GGI09_006225 [Coemansia sp. S100]KAJ2103310.1 hypothetical protein IW146_008907 [Coemansia sp. RSA 922]KAJ2346029.1 hypothetical protein GGH92_003785 [Coemansia sp. RSA 2673]KAJ2425086.1 hypothetical protein GGF41_002553 [Coemansia sp. RSA 2531]KAJ2461952.1 hypothetical 
MAAPDKTLSSRSAHTKSEQRQQRDEIEELLSLDPSNNLSLEQQYDVLTNVEQKRALQKLVLQSEADIQAFSLFLKLPTMALLMLNLVFAYNYAMSGLGSSSHFAEATLPFISYAIHAEHPIVATELSVVTLQFTIYLLSSRRWDWVTQTGLSVLLFFSVTHALTCRKNGIAELLWWSLPAMNLAVASYAQLNMRRSQRNIESLAQRTYKSKDE